MSHLRRMRPLLGTFVEIGIVAPVSADFGLAAITHAFHLIERIHDLLSFQNPDSELSRLNRSRVAIPLHPWSALALRLARVMTIASGHLFNCTVGGALIEARVLPNHSGQPYLLHGHAGDIALRGYRASRLQPVQITLDGIAKGLAVDLAARGLRASGMAGGWVNAGGDLLAFGTAAIPLHRRELDGSLLPIGVLRNGAIASSAVTATPDGRTPGVIVSSGAAPAANGVWSVYAARAWRADALTKVAALAAADERAALIETLGGRLLHAPQVDAA